MQQKRLQGSAQKIVELDDTVKLKGMIMLNRCDFRCVLKVENVFGLSERLIEKVKDPFCTH